MMHRGGRVVLARLACRDGSLFMIPAHCRARRPPRAHRSARTPRAAHAGIVATRTVVECNPLGIAFSKRAARDRSLLAAGEMRDPHPFAREANRREWTQVRSKSQAL